ncbi:MAG: DUF4437 domain-containing protein, partial [Bacteroidota bacterium]
RTGNLLKLPAGFKGEILSEGQSFHAIVITGAAAYQMPQTKEIKSLDPGSYFTSNGKAKHSVETNNSSETIIYIRTNGKFHLR